MKKLILGLIAGLILAFFPLVLKYNRQIIDANAESTIQKQRGDSLQTLLTETRDTLKDKNLIVDFLTRNNHLDTTLFVLLLEHTLEGARNKGSYEDRFMLPTANF